MSLSKLSPQAQVVLKHLQTVGSISNVEAHAVHRIRSLSRRVTELGDAGYRIKKQQKRDFTGQRYVRYVPEPCVVINGEPCNCNHCMAFPKAAA